MARPKNADGQRTRQAILDAALELFADKGYFGTSLRDVAGAVGVRESALYNYFKSKDALFDALILDHQHDKAERVAWLTGGQDADGRVILERLAIGSLESFVVPREQMLFRLLMSDGIRLARTGHFNLYQRFGRGLEQLKEVMQGLIRRGVLRKGDPHVLAMTFVGPLMLWRQLHAAGADLPMIRKPRAFARRHVDQFFQGASALPRRPTGPPRKRVVKPSRRTASSRRQPS
jgi:AcrR family transcriptional regulator